MKAKTRAGVVRPAATDGDDPRIRIDLAHLRRLGPRAAGLNFLPRQKARSVLNGRHASLLRGRGLNFEELRGYLPGDDVRSIDWKVTARTGEPHIRVFTEERDRPALLVVDQRMSMFFGTRLNMKSVTAAEAAALAAFRILDQGDRIGGIVFGDEMIAEIRPQRSRRAMNQLHTAIANAQNLLGADAPSVTPMSLNRPLEAVARIAKRDHLVIILSDFDEVDGRTETLLGGLARHNDVIVGLVTDPTDHAMSLHPRLIASDGQLQAEIDIGSPPVRDAMRDFLTARVAEITGWTRRYGIPVLPLSAGEETLAQMMRLFGLRGGR
ncbi:DUF58 domain-containing protein [Rhodobacteraceae bacterium NNCM2]|nr:DUF58 domain-containing protein [Coraliihabitans acroporae]